MHWYRSASSLDKPLAKVVAAAKLLSVSLHSFGGRYENLLTKAGVDQLVRRSLAGWRSQDAQDIYACVDRDERDQAARAVLQLVHGDGLGGGINTRTQHPRPKNENAREDGISNRASSQADFESGTRDSNSRLQPWEGCTLPTELVPLGLQIGDLASGSFSVNARAAL